MPFTLPAPPAWLVREQARHLASWLLSPPLSTPITPTEAQIDALVDAINDGRVLKAFAEAER